LDLKASAGYVVVPPTSLDRRGRYSWDAGARPTEIPLAPIPEWLVELDASPNGDRPSVRAKPTGEAYRRVTEALRYRGSVRQGDKWQCPGHNDANPSLNVHEAIDGKVLLKCFAGCRTEDVVAALGSRLADLFDTLSFPELRAATAPATPIAEPEESDSRPRAVDVNALTTQGEESQTFVIDDILTAGGILGVAGEEGEGKTLLAEQIVRQSLRGEPIAGFFDPGEVCPTKGPAP
jgi:hypothetical protein